MRPWEATVDPLNAGTVSQGNGSWSFECQIVRLSVPRQCLLHRRRRRFAYSRFRPIYSPADLYESVMWHDASPTGLPLLNFFEKKIPSLIITSQNICWFYFPVLASRGMEQGSSSINMKTKIAEVTHLYCQKVFVVPEQRPLSRRR